MDGSSSALMSDLTRPLLADTTPSETVSVVISQTEAAHVSATARTVIHNTTSTQTDPIAAPQRCLSYQQIHRYQIYTLVTACLALWSWVIVDIYFLSSIQQLTYGRDDRYIDHAYDQIDLATNITMPVFGTSLATYCILWCMKRCYQIRDERTDRRP